jgi:hypothetical protein
MVYMASPSDRRKYFPEDIWKSLEYYANDEKMRVESPEVKQLMTPDSMAWGILKEFLRVKGHYPPKSGD